MAAKSLVVLFKLKAGQSAAAYEAWARTVDLPTVRGLPSIDSFRVMRSDGLFGAEGKPPYDYVEIIDIADPEQFGTDIATEAMQSVARQFAEFADIVFVEVTELEAAS